MMGFGGVGKVYLLLLGRGMRSILRKYEKSVCDTESN